MWRHKSLGSKKAYRTWIPLYPKFCLYSCIHYNKCYYLALLIPSLVDKTDEATLNQCKYTPFEISPAIYFWLPPTEKQTWTLNIFQIGELLPVDIWQHIQVRQIIHFLGVAHSRLRIKPSLCQKIKKNTVSSRTENYPMATVKIFQKFCHLIFC